LAGALTCGLAVPALGQTAPTTGEFKVYWAVASGNPAPGERWRDWTASIQFGQAPIHRNIQVFYEWNTGIFPAAGMHVVEMDSNYMTRHFDRLRRTVAEQFPDPNAEGFGALDYEGFTPAWDFIINVPSNQGPLAHDLDIKDDWRDFIREYRPHLLTGLTAELQEQVFAQTFNESARRFFLDTLAECKRLRPNVKWGYYLYPPRRYYDYLRADRLTAWRERHRRELMWLYDAMDVFFPDVYSLYYTVESNPNYRIGQDSQEEAAAYITGNVREAVEIANGRPVIAFISHRYTVNAGQWQHQMVNARNLRNQFELPKLAGANGVAIWDNINSEARFAEVQQYTTTMTVPLVMEFATDVPPPTPPAPPPAPAPDNPTPPAPPPPAPDNPTPPAPPPPAPDNPTPPAPPPPAPDNPTPPPTNETGDGGSTPPPAPPMPPAPAPDIPGDQGGGPTPAPLAPAPPPPPAPVVDDPDPTPPPSGEGSNLRRTRGGDPNPTSGGRRDRRAGSTTTNPPSQPQSEPTQPPTPQAPAPTTPSPAPSADDPSPPQDDGVIRIEIRTNRNSHRGPFTSSTPNSRTQRYASPTARAQMARAQSARGPILRQGLSAQIRPHSSRFANRVVGSPDRSAVVNELRRARENRLGDMVDGSNPRP
jgi:hypothetical protein